MPEAARPQHRSPYPGLRAFRTSEARFFFGRDAHTEALLQRLARGRFLAVVGASGGGKSSLVRAGLLPALYRGYLSGATTRWRIAVMRPGGAPVEALGQALAAEGRMGTTQECLRLLEATTLGLVDVAEQGGLAPRESLLVVADQFEELFRYDASEGLSEDRRHFVSLLLNAVDRAAPHVYVVLTMRYEYLADCAVFPGLPEALNVSQYLIPRLTREQRRSAIEDPLRLVGVGIEPSLVQAVLNEAGDDPYQLPVLQHALHRTYGCWEAAGAMGPITLGHYEQAGRIARALDVHANEIQDRLDPAVRPLVEPLFRSLTVTDDEGRCTRRPRTLDQLRRVMGAVSDPARAKGIATAVKAFAAPEHSLLLLSSDELGPDTEVDVSHESLIVKWKRLTAAARNEARSAARYRDLAHATLRHAGRESGLWRDPDLKQVLRLRERECWNASWAEQYWTPGVPPSFEETDAFLKKSKRFQRLTRAAIALAIVSVLSLAGYGYRSQLRLNESQLENARAQADLAALRLQVEQSKNLVAQREQELTAAKAGNASQSDIEARERELAAARASLTQAQQAAAAAPKPTDDPAALRGRIKQLEERLATADKELTAAQQQISDLGRQLGAAQQRIKELESRAPDSELSRRATAAEARVRELEAAQGPATAQKPPPAEPSGVRKGLEWYQSYEEGQKALGEGKFPEAVFYLRRALETAPKDARNLKYLTREFPYYVPHYYLALAYMGYGSFDEACRSAKLAVESGIAQQKEDFRAPLAAVRSYCDQRASARGD